MSTKYLQVRGGTLAYEDTGSGPLVICVPSMGDLRAEYRFLISQLAAAGYRAVSLDVRGHGETSVGWQDTSVAGIGSDLVALVRALNAGPAVLVGASMAAGAAVWAAAEAPEWVAGLALIGPFVRNGESTLRTRLFNRLLPLLFARPWGAQAWVAYYTSLYPTHKPDDFDTYRAALRANLAQPGRLEALHGMLSASKAASELRLPRVKAPTLVLMGSQDPDFEDPEAEARWVAEHLHARYQMIQGAGHYPQAEMPETTAGLLLPFLASVSRTQERAYAA